MLKATCRTLVQLCNHKITCALLDNGMRVVSVMSIDALFGIPPKYYNSRTIGDVAIPYCLSPKNVEKYIDENVIPLFTPIFYKNRKGNLCSGYDANLIPAICRIYLALARDAKSIRPFQKKRVETAIEILGIFKENQIQNFIDQALGLPVCTTDEEQQSLFTSNTVSPTSPYHEKLAEEVVDSSVTNKERQAPDNGKLLFLKTHQKELSDHFYLRLFPHHARTGIERWQYLPLKVDPTTERVDFREFCVRLQTLVIASNNDLDKLQEDFCAIFGEFKFITDLLRNERSELLEA